MNEYKNLVSRSNQTNSSSFDYKFKYKKETCKIEEPKLSTEIDNLFIIVIKLDGHHMQTLKLSVN